MNRKRFIKCLMGKGLPRNKANIFAAELNKRQIPYHSCAVTDIIRTGKGSYTGNCLLPTSISKILMLSIRKELETGSSEDDIIWKTIDNMRIAPAN